MTNLLDLALLELYLNLRAVEKHLTGNERDSHMIHLFNVTRPLDNRKLSRAIFKGKATQASAIVAEMMKG